ncbi:MAG: vitamin B12-dependent ribonucleotide reductase [Candidatus Andersenbacteria bacterium]
MTPARPKGPTQIKKRDGRVVDFDTSRITRAIFKAADEVGLGDEATADRLANRVVSIARDKFGADRIPNVEEIQDIVEIVLIDSGQAKIAKAYILYRQKHAQLREAKKAILGREVSGKVKVSVNSLRVLKERYLRKDEDGKLIETPDGLFWRVANNIAQGDAQYEPSRGRVEETAQTFFDMMANMSFMPNSPTLMNAGNILQQLSACFVVPVEDSLEGIFDSIKNAALIHQSGGGTGFAFSRLRPANDRISSTKGVASGPVSFMRVFNAATDVIKQGGKRRGANMGILRVDHPDVLDFITIKQNLAEMTNFNISVAITEQFMRAVEQDADYPLVNPRSGEIVQWLPAKQVFDLMVTSAWKHGDPGIVFIDRINRDNPTPQLGEMESTNPCGEQPLLPYEACNLGSINLAMFVDDSKKIDWVGLRKLTHDCIHFLDNVVTMNRYPLPQIHKIATENRRIGLGVMGWADMLIKMNIPYDSEEACQLGEKVMRFINVEAKASSINLAKERGVFKNWKGSRYDVPGGPRVRNCTVTTIAPTGTISMIADCSSGIEPIFAVVFIKNVMDGQELLYVNPYFEQIAKERGFYSEALMRKVAEEGSIQHIEEIPKDVRRLFVTAQDISPTWHLQQQAAFQRHCDNAVSKTINFANEATVEDVRETYMLAYKLGLKGVTMFRDGSRDQQVLQTKKTKSLMGGKAQTTAISSDAIKQSILAHAAQPRKVAAPAQLEMQMSVDTGLLRDWMEYKRESFAMTNAGSGPGAATVAELKQKVATTTVGVATHGATESTVCPECKGTLTIQEGCGVCNSCGFSYCHN